MIAPVVLGPPVGEVARIATGEQLICDCMRLAFLVRCRDDDALVITCGHCGVDVLVLGLWAEATL